MKREDTLEREHERRLEAAMDWMLRLREEVASEQDILRWLEWCEADPRNQQAFDRIESMWALAGGLSDEVVNGELLAAPDEAAGGKPVGTDDRGSFAVARSSFASGLRAHGRSVAFGALSAAAILVVSLPLRHSTFQGPADQIEAIAPSRSLAAPAVVELVREARLDDGSVVQLAAKSTVSVDFTADQRTLDLAGGEAFFEVAHDEDRPFVVVAGKTRIRAVGTAFNVRRAHERVVVTVTEGMVEVTRPGLPRTRGPQTRNPERLVSMTLSAGSQMRWGGAEENPVLASVDPTAALGWREGRLVYADEPLAAVIADLNRYADRPVELRGAALAGLRFSGTLLARETDEWLRALPSSLPVRIEAQGATWVVLPMISKGQG